MDNNQQDMQKRMFIFFAIVAVLMIAYSIFASFFMSDDKKQGIQQASQKTEVVQKTEISQNTQTTQKPQQKQESSVIYSTGGTFNLLLDSRRFRADDLKNLVTLKTEFGTVKFSKIGGRVVSIYIDRYKTDVIGSFSKQNKIFPTEIITTDPQITALINFSEYQVSQNGNKLVFTLEKNGIKVVKEFILEKAVFKINIKTEGLDKYGLAVINGVVPDKTERDFGHYGPVVKTEDRLLQLDENIEKEQIIRGKILWAGEENEYFIQMIASKEGFPATHIIPVAQDKTVVLSEIDTGLDGFFLGGPKLYSLLKELTEKYQKEWGIDLALQETVDFGIFGILGKPLFIVLHFFYDFTHNWGVAIILLTILIRIIFFPLNHKSLKAMKKMSDLAPEIKKLQQKYKDDPQKLQQEMMKLYAEHGANPMSGCLPILVQIPVFIALYNVLMVTVELKNAPFILWITDLSSKDPYYILPILMGLSMVAQQWITPSSDKNQKMIMYIMAVVFTFMFMNFPSGLVLYWLTNNILGLLQSYIINKKLGRYEKKPAK